MYEDAERAMEYRRHRGQASRAAYNGRGDLAELRSLVAEKRRKTAVMEPPAHVGFEVLRESDGQWIGVTDGYMREWLYTFGCDIEANIAKMQAHPGCVMRSEGRRFRWSGPAAVAEQEAA